MGPHPPHYRTGRTAHPASRGVRRQSLLHQRQRSSPARFQYSGRSGQSHGHLPVGASCNCIHCARVNRNNRPTGSSSWAPSCGSWLESLPVEKQVDRARSKNDQYDRTDCNTNTPRRPKDQKTRDNEHRALEHHTEDALRFGHVSLSLWGLRRRAAKASATAVVILPALSLRRAIANVLMRAASESSPFLVGNIHGSYHEVMRPFAFESVAA
jgi:hypothetical protein